MEVYVYQLVFQFFMTSVTQTGLQVTVSDAKMGILGRFKNEMLLTHSVNNFKYLDVYLVLKLT